MIFLIPKVVFMTSKRNVIIVAPWGYPPQWQKSRYSVSLDDRGILIKDFECQTCSSTISLAAALRERADIDLRKIIIIGLDTVLSPKESPDGKSHRDKVKMWFRDVISELIDRKNCNCCDFLTEDLFDVIIVPGIGTFYGYTFKGSVNHIFLRVFSEIARYLDDLIHVDVFLDTTHGVNYQVIATLYATIAAIVSSDPELKIENRLFIMNSEPFPQGVKTSRCIQPLNLPTKPQNLRSIQTSEISQLPFLGIQNFSELHNAIRALRAITNLSMLDERPLKRFLSIIKRKSELEEQLNRLTQFFKYLRLGLAGLVYPHSNFELNAYKINEMIADFYAIARKELTKDFTPHIDHDRKIITYENASIHYALSKILERIRQSIIEKLSNAKNINEFKKKLQEIYDKKNMKDKVFIIEREFYSLQEMLKMLEAS